MPSLAERLIAAACRRAEDDRERGLERRVVRRFVREHLDTLRAMRACLGTWSAVADILDAEGLRWRGGQSVTGPQLRSLISQVSRRRAERQARAAAETPSPATVRSEKPERPDASGLARLLDTPAPTRRRMP